MNSRKVEFSIINRKELSPSQPNSVIVVIDTKSEEIFENPTTGHQTRRRPTQVSPPFLIDINLRSSSHDHIRTLLHDRLVGYPWGCLCDILATKVSTEAINLGFGRNGFTLTMTVTVTYQTVFVTSNVEKSLRMVLLGRVKAEELKSLKMDTESCSICLENLSDPKLIHVTRMTCSHVFHNRCLLEWLKRKNTCPLCRTELYD